MDFVPTMQCVSGNTLCVLRFLYLFKYRLKTKRKQWVRHFGNDFSKIQALNTFLVESSCLSTIF